MPQDLLADYTPDQLRKAMDLIQDSAILPVATGVYIAVSSNGRDRYTVVPAIDDCTCKAGQHGLRCYHLAAAHALTAGTRQLVEV